jgi:hypothetical protein
MVNSNSAEPLFGETKMDTNFGATTISSNDIDDDALEMSQEGLQHDIDVGHDVAKWSEQDRKHYFEELVPRGYYVYDRSGNKLLQWKMNFADYRRAIDMAADRLVSTKFNSNGELGCIRDFVQQHDRHIQAIAQDLFGDYCTLEFVTDAYAGDTDAAIARTQQLLELAVIQQCLDADEYLLAAVAQ